MKWDWTKRIASQLFEKISWDPKGSKMTEKKTEKVSEEEG